MQNCKYWTACDCQKRISRIFLNSTLVSCCPHARIFKHLINDSEGKKIALTCFKKNYEFWHRLKKFLTKDINFEKSCQAIHLSHLPSLFLFLYPSHSFSLILFLSLSFFICHTFSFFLFYPPSLSLSIPLSHSFLSVEIMRSKAFRPFLPHLGQKCVLLSKVFCSGRKSKIFFNLLNRSIYECLNEWVRACVCVCVRECACACVTGRRGR